jgi:hypothetical protein
MTPSRARLHVASSRTSKNFEEMTVWVLEVHTPATITLADYARATLAGVRPIVDTALSYAPEDLVELRLTDEKSIVLRGNLVFDLMEIQRDSVTKFDNQEWSNARRLWKTKNFAQKCR